MPINNNLPNPKISVIVPAYNEENYIEKTLQDIISQDYEEDFELIVVDNNSTDRTAEIAKKYGATVIHEPKKGTRFAYDRGMRDAKGEILFLTNADSRIPKNWISTLIKYYNDPKLVGVGSHIEFYSAPFYVDWAWHLIWFVGEIALKLGLLGVKERTFWGPSLTCRKEVFLKVGGMDHGANVNEDYIFTELIRKHGKAPYVYEAIVKIDARRFAGNPIMAAKNWLFGYGINSLILAFTGKSKIKDFKDIRLESPKSILREPQDDIKSKG